MGNLKTGHSQLAGWYSEILGRALAHAEQELLNSILPDLFGYHLLQIGNHKSLHWLKSSRIRHHVGVAPDGISLHDGTWVRGWYDSLPFRSDSLDVVILPHTLEFCVDPQKVLEEASRVLLSEGHILIFGFNPYSSWGVRRIFRSHDGSVPWSGHFLSSSRVEQWLADFGCTVVKRESVFFRPPTTHSFWLDKLSFLEKIMPHLSSSAGAVYLLQAKKQTMTLAPIKPRWSLHRVFDTKSLVEPTTRKAGVSHGQGS